MTFDLSLLADCFLRLGVAIVAGGILGLERELAGHWAGLRTHMMVSLGAAAFMLLGTEVAGGDVNALSRVIQGVVAGVGFLGAGAILKTDTHHRITGLTTASTLWLAAALGALAGSGRYELLVACLLLAVVVLVALRPMSRLLARHAYHDQADLPSSKAAPRK